MKSNAVRILRAGAVLMLLAVLLPVCKKPPVNYPPDTLAAPSGPSSAPRDSTCWFTAVATDPDGDSVSLRFDCGDGDTSGWSPLAPSGATVTMSHAWRDYGTYPVRTQARDVDGATSSWSDSLSFNVGPPCRWRYLTGGEVSASPAVVADGTVYVGSSDNYLCAIQRDSPLADPPWPKFHHDNRTTGRVGGPR